jgi:HlyD family secretion protein
MKLFRINYALGLLVLVTGVFATYMILGVIWPAYQRPMNRSYESRYGYPAIRRLLGLTFPVETSMPERRTIVSAQLGEGRMTSMEIRVPIVPTGRILSVPVQEGERVTKGEVLAEMDTTLAQLQVDASKLIVENAQAELERVKLSSVSTLNQERPEQEGINIEASKKQIEIAQERLALMQELYKENAISKAQLLQPESELAEAEQAMKSSQLGVDVSAKGLHESIEIADNFLQQQENLLQQRIVDLDNYKVCAPADGILESVLVNPGEFNQTTGNVGFVIASGDWFEGHLDQTAYGKVNIGDKAQVFLEAIPQKPLEGTVTRIVPIVTYSSSGPETPHLPTRVTGIGTPEWPTTFTAIIEFSPEDLAGLSPGMTGFARIEAQRDVLSVPRAAVTAITGKKGVVYVLRNGKSETREVAIGDSWMDWTEITKGITEREKVVISGQEDLLPSDRMTDTSGPH